MKIKSILFLLLLITLSACASNTTKSNEPIQLMDGSNLFIVKGKVVKITDKTGATVEIQTGRMQELANGDYIYIRRDGTVSKMGESKSSHGHSSKSSSGHSH
jgi:ABC-type Fe3+-hydroxamate transport system substrate-binding protein